MACAALLCAAIIGSSACQGEQGNDIIVQLRTDLVSGVEFDRVGITLLPRRGSNVIKELEVEVGVSGAVPVMRVAELQGVTSGSYRVEVSLSKTGVAEALTSRPVIAEVRGSLSLTVPISRSCLNVLCPQEGAEELSACLGGTCVDPRCTEESTEFCATEASGCSDDQDCPVAAACAVGECILGVCWAITLPEGLPEACTAEQWCDPTSGCQALASSSEPAPPIDEPPIDDPPAPPPIVVRSALRIGSTSFHSCALSSTKRAYCWGRGDTGQIGDGLRLPRATPTQVANLGEVALVAAGHNHSCAVDTTGQVYCWGSNSRGELGNGTFHSFPEAVPAMDDVVDLQLLEQASCALRANDELWCWGRNDFGQMGIAAGADESAPVKVLGDVASFDAGTYHLCAIRNDGSLLCWGRNSEGQLGDGSTEARNAPVSPLTLSGVLEVAAARDSTCARTAESVYCWGGGLQGQLGDGTAPILRSTPSIVPGLTNTVALRGGGRYNCALENTGVLRCWGLHWDGRLGIGPVDANQRSPQVVQLPSAAVDVALGNSHGCARLETGALYCWGSNTEQAVGNGSGEQEFTPVPITALP